MMREYDWSRVAHRSLFTLMLGPGSVFLAHNGKFTAQPPICNAGWPEALWYLVVYFLSVVAIEGLHWLAWYISEKLNSPQTAVQAETSGGVLLAPHGLFLGFVFAWFLLWVSRRLGAPTPCESIQLNLAWNNILGCFALGYGMVAFGEVMATMIRRNSPGTPPASATDR
ncbi:MAG: hypothetical protein WBC04_05000 [Candidatus Acidiferrales bacterium]